MGPDASTHVRNAAIVVALAVVVWLIPGGETGSNTVGNVLSVILLGGLCFFAYRLYMEHRIALLDLPDRSRVVLYGSFALIVFAVVATNRLWDTGFGGLIWLALLAAAGYGIYSVYRSEKAY
jgi:hypothetical protein